MTAPDAAPDVTVIMATYNRGRHIVPSIRSVLMQEGPTAELLVVGDGCTDDTGEVVRAFPSDRVRWIERPHGGSQSFANNAGIAAARGRLIAYIGHDDVWARGHLADLMALFEARPGLDVGVAGAAYHRPGGLDPLRVTGLFVGEGGKVAATHFFPPSSIAHRRDLTERIGPWADPVTVRAPVDADLQLRAVAAGMSFASTERLSVHKFAAGHRYLDYVEHSSGEQEAMLERAHGDGAEALAAETVGRSRRTGFLMSLHHADFTAFEPGEIHARNRRAKGLGVALRPLHRRETLTPRAGYYALDWQGEPRHGTLWAHRNPRPRILLPFTGEGRARLNVPLVHPADVDPSAVVLEGPGIDWRGGRPHDGPAPSGCAITWLSARLDLRGNAPSVATLRLPDVGEADLPRYGIGTVVVDPPDVPGPRLAHI